MNFIFQKYISLFSFLCIASLSVGQTSTCPNADFEFGDFTNWEGFTGECCPIVMDGNQIVNGRHTIMTGNGGDPITNDTLKLVAPGGGKFSARLGNSFTNAEAEQLRYSFTVTPQTALFIYRYAVVLEDPNHLASEQPRFEIKVLDAGGNPLTCGTYFVFSQVGIPGFHTIPYGDSEVHWKDWTTVGINLSDYIGQKVTISLATGDCSKGAHFGYSYLDCYCSALAIQSDYCPGSFTTTLEAPPGFESYLWTTGETTQTITVTNPIEGTPYGVTLTSVTGCKVDLSMTLTKTVIQPEFEMIDSCQNAVRFYDRSKVITGRPIDSYYWDFGDGTTSTDSVAIHKYANPGEYTIKLVVKNGGGCTDTISDKVKILPFPKADFTVSNACFGSNATLNDISTSSNSNIVSTLWDLGNGITKTNIPNLSYVFPDSLGSTVKLLVMDEYGCKDSILKQITPFKKPDAAFGTLSPLCENTLISFKDSSVANEGTITSTKWNFGDGTVSTEQNPVKKFVNNGDYNVSLMVETDKGCKDTLIKAMKIYNTPFISATVNIDSVYFSDTVELRATQNPDFAYLWSPNELVNPSNTAFTFGTIENSTWFKVNIRDIYGCENADSVFVFMIDDCTPDFVIIPSGFSPNGDNLNDSYGVLNKDKLNEFSLSIYDRWNKLVYFSDNQSEKWKGSELIKDLQTDVFIYIVKYRCAKGDWITKKGTLTILR